MITIKDIRTVTFSSSLDALTEVNSSFDRGVLKIAYHGKSRNKTIISKECFEDALPSLFNCPIVCRYDIDEDAIGSHDMQVVHNDSSIRFINATDPVGVIPESASTWWEEVTEDNGEVHEYLFTDALIWKRQAAYQHIKENGITDESMEIKVLAGEPQDDGFYRVDKFEFTAFCLLESAEPCFESASLEMFSLADFKDKWAAMLSDLHEYAKQVITADADDDTNTTTEGGTNGLNIDELMAKYGLTAEDMTFSTDGMSDADIELKFAEIASQKSDCAAPQEDGDGTPPENFSLTSSQLVNVLSEELSKETYINSYWREESKRYWYMDHNEADMVVYAFDDKNRYDVKFSYTMNGDHPVIDFASGKRQKTVYVDFDEGSDTANFALSDMIDGIRKTYDDHFSSIVNERDELAQFKLDTIKAQRNDAVQSVFSKFPELNGVESFEQLKSDNAEMTPEQVEERCYAIKGRMASTVNFSLKDQKPSGVILPIEGDSEPNMPDDEPYGGLFWKYGLGR